MTPQDIQPAKHVNLILGSCVAFLALFALFPVVAVTYYDGISSFGSWPAIFFVLLIVGVSLLVFGLWLLLTPQRVGIEVAFKEGGFEFERRGFLRRDQAFHVTWREIEEVKLVKVPRGGDILAFRLTHAAAVAKGLIEPTTRISSSKKLVKREVSLSSNLMNVSVDEAFLRFEASAQQAGAVLTSQANFNALIVARKAWSVEWPTD